MTTNGGAMYGFDQFLSARSAFGARFSADGTRLFFLSDLSGAPRLWALPLDASGAAPGAWPEPVAVDMDRVTGAYPAPVSDRLVLVADVGGNERTQLFLLERPGMTPRPLTDTHQAIHTFGGWHPDGRTIAFSSNERDARFFDAYVLDVETGARRAVFEGDGTFYAAGFSPDGRLLAVQQADSAWEHAVYVVDVESGAARRLTPPGVARYRQLAWAADGQSIYCVTDAGRDFLGLAALAAEDGALRWVACAEWDVDDFALAPDGSRVAYEVNVEGFSEVRVRVLATGEERSLSLPLGQAYEPYRWFPTFAWAPDSARFALTVSTSTTPAAVYLADAAGLGIERVTRAWSAGLDPAELAPAELVHYPTFDGRRIPAFVFRPRGHRDDGSSPAVFYVHGGPESQLRTMYNGVIQYFVHRGYVVVAPNVRGSLGYGNPYVHLDDVELRMDSVRDLAAGAEWASATGLAHPKKLAVMGASYGGFMVLASLTSYPELWAAGIDVVGIANFVSFLENTGPWRRHHREVEYGSLARDRALLEAISPLHKADRIVAPLFVVHGANDPRVPVGEAEQIVASLRKRGRPVEYLRFEDEGHGLVKLRNRVAAYPRIADFLERHLSAPDAPGAPPSLAVTAGSAS